jgi:ABC-type multidrug transport system ATPase subunit
MAPFVALHSVTKTYGPVRALVGVDARFDAGRVSMVEGANGSGKSTLLSIAAALTKPTAGRVEHAGLGTSRSEVRASLGWVGHDTLAYGELTGRENVELAARLHGVDVKQAWQRTSERFELAAFGDRPVRTYSRGQRQRVALARALVSEPQLVLLDEPTAGLDARATERLSRVVREEATRGAVVIVVTHDAAFAELGDARLRLERGRVVE